MTVNTYTTDDSTVVVEYVADDGESATAEVVGLSLSEVEDRAKEIVDAHDLSSKT